MRVCEGQYSRAEVAKHCTKEDLWIIIEDRVRTNTNTHRSLLSLHFVVFVLCRGMPP